MGLCPGTGATGRAGKHYCSSHSASSLLSSPWGGWVHAPLVAGCRGTDVQHPPHIHHVYWGNICPSANKSVPFPLLLLPSSILCFWEKERSASVELGCSFSGKDQQSNSSYHSIKQTFLESLLRQLAKQGLCWRKHINSPFYSIKRRKTYLKTPL